MLSFSWNCDVMVESADSHGATRPSYFGPESQKFNSSGLAACAGLRAVAASSAPRAAARASLGLILFWGLRARMDGPRNGRGRADGAAKPRLGQVQAGNTLRTSRHQPHSRPFLGTRRALRCPEPKESAMRRIWAAGLVALVGLLADAPARADWLAA